MHKAMSVKFNVRESSSFNDVDDPSLWQDDLAADVLGAVVLMRCDHVLCTFITTSGLAALMTT